ncbi:hypothetical protein ELH53_32940 [Rhizobium ruizarguesonis]|uniref:hypothetical protein n=1 Tax=Rhizobium ruizarguesonis TaxID=2081791 RepID=UPI001031F3B8|nr:hypothetical protein [Rhizobium ruizarguesonis]TBA75488.1 hypothetical protein ELH53_32940 [Rhizobium ruizarguesonis]
MILIRPRLGRSRIALALLDVEICGSRVESVHGEGLLETVPALRNNFGQRIQPVQVIALFFVVDFDVAYLFRLAGASLRLSGHSPSKTEFPSQLRTRKAIRVQASVLGKAHKRHCWTGAQVALLRKLYPDASRERLCESFPDVSWNASRDPLRIVRIQSDEPIGFSASRGRELFVGEGGNLHGPFVKPGEGRAAHHNMAAEKQAIRKVICRSPQ